MVGPMKEETYFPKKRKFDGKWYYLSPSTHHFVSKKRAEDEANYYRKDGSARIIKVKYGYIVYRRGGYRGWKNYTYGKITSDYLKDVRKVYYCGKCKRYHNNKSKIGKQHRNLDL